MANLAIYYLTFCFFLAGTIHSTNAAELRYYKGCLDSYETAPLDSPLKLCKYLDKSKDTLVYTFGFQSDPDADSAKAVLSAYLSLGKYNVLLLDWTEEAKTLLTSLEYPATILKARKVASDFGDALVQLIKSGISADSITLCGHSLGAHVVGWAGKKVQKSNYKLGRIIGLDPAGPLFSCNIGFDGLKPSAAIFVLAVHTNPGKYGSDESLGTADFWANCDKHSVQPGCSGRDKQSCSHNRVCFLHAEAVTNPDAFLVQGASKCKAWKSHDYNHVTSSYGDHVNTSLSGSFFFSTNSESPYARGKHGLTPC